jgi:hypothetical protein
MVFFQPNKNNLALNFDYQPLWIKDTVFPQKPESKKFNFVSDGRLAGEK